MVKGEMEEAAPKTRKQSGQAIEETRKLFATIRVKSERHEGSVSAIETVPTVGESLCTVKTEDEEAVHMAAKDSFGFEL
jgi:hypothetical protein